MHPMDALDLTHLKQEDTTSHLLVVSTCDRVNFRGKILRPLNPLYPTRAIKLTNTIFWMHVEIRINLKSVH